MIARALHLFVIAVSFAALMVFFALGLPIIGLARVLNQGYCWFVDWLSGYSNQYVLRYLPNKTKKEQDDAREDASPDPPG